MTCEEFFDKHYDGYELSSWIDEMFWDDSFSCEKVFQDMCESAKQLNVTLTDTEDFDYDSFFWNVYKNTEKGLS